MDKDYLKRIILEQREISNEPNDKIIEREILKEIKQDKKSKQVSVISGIRRCGKSVLLDLIRKDNKESDYYLNFDDERLFNFSLKDFTKLEELFLELFGQQKIFYFDEIQNIVGWEKFVRRLHNENKKVYVTGSNASMLSRELGTRLTGRYLKRELYPFSFREFLKFHSVRYDSKSILLTKERSKIKKFFQKYLTLGGFPEYLKTKRVDYLDALYESILYRDIIVRHKINKEKSMKELVYFCASNISQKVSFNSLTKLIGVRNATTVKDYLDYLEDAYLIFSLSRYNYSVYKQIFSSKKIYFIDLGLAKHLGFSFSENRGHYLENLVFLELKRDSKDIYFYSNKGECDFIIREGVQIKTAIQVCYNLNKQNQDRESNGLLEAMNEFGLKNGLILTYDQEKTILIDGKTIFIKPIWQWLIEKI